MEFFVVLFQTVVKMILLMAVAVGGIFLGKFIRDKKDAKNTSVEESKS